MLRGGGRSAHLSEEDVCRGQVGRDVTVPLVQSHQDRCVHEVRKPRVVVLEDDGGSQLLGVLTEQQPCGHRRPSHWKSAEASKEADLVERQTHVLREHSK